MSESTSIPSTYDVVLADPPWDHYGAATKWAAAAKEYSLIPDDEMVKFPMRDWMNKPGVLFLWATCPRLDFAIHCIESWGLHYRGVAFVWVKSTAAGVPILAQGVRPSITKPLTEFVLAASTERRGRPLPLGSEAITQTGFGEEEFHTQPFRAARGVHSEKPDWVMNSIDVMYPEMSKIELFCRGKANEGWDNWGDQADV